MRLWEQKSVIGLTERNAPNGASKFCTIIRTEIDNFVFPIYTLTLRYFSNTFHHDSAPARPRSREVRALLLNVRRRPIARWKAYLNSYALSTKRAIWLGEPDHWFLLSEPHIYISLSWEITKWDTDLERFLVYLCIGVKLLILDTLSTYTYEIDLKNLHLNTPFLLVLNNSLRGGVNNFMPFRKQRLSKCCIFGDIFSKYMNLSIFVLRLIWGPVRPLECR